ncbi:MAG: LemA family protein [Candidatus Shapirobacteria bacterium]
MWLFLILLLAGAGIYVWSTYNSLIAQKTRIGASLQEIGNQLKRQTDLIPNLIASVKGYIEHEQEIFDKLTQARQGVLTATSSGGAQEMINAGSQLQAALAPIRAIFEANPQLQAAETVTQLMEELRDTADKVMYSRRTLIDLTADYNIRLAVFPSNLIAKIFHFLTEKGLTLPEEKEFLSVKSEELQTPTVKL